MTLRLSRLVLALVLVPETASNSFPEDRFHKPGGLDILKGVR